MYGLLVVDDEPHHRRGIADMLRGLRQEYRIFTAKDGEEALSIVLDNPVDIIITDIRMPNMDGLQLIEALLKQPRRIKIVILSVYGQFNYARKALTLGAFDYLLKPLKREEMSEMLGKLETSLEEEKRQMLEAESLKRKLHSSIPVYEQHLLNRWVRGELSDSDQEEMSRLLPDRKASLIITLKFNQVEEFEEFKLKFKSWFQPLLDLIGSSICFYLDGMEPLLVSILSPKHQVEWLLHSDLVQLAEVISRVQLEFGLSAAIGVGEIVADPYRDIHFSFRQALDALDFTFYQGYSSLLIFSEIAYDPKKPVLRPYSSESKIGTAVTQLDRKLAEEALEEFIGQLQEGKRPSPAHLKERVLYMLVTQTKNNEALLGREEAGNLISEMEFELPACPSLGELTLKVTYYLGRIIDGMENRKKNKSQVIIQMCIVYLEEHYMEDLSMEMIAKRYFFSPAYFSGLFKVQTSLTFTEFLLGLRIEKAKTFLGDSDRKVSEVAFAVGFRDAGYFTRIFKRETGLSPEEYRKNMVV
ncbi:response regulator [Paenibacillus sp. 5J-6]|uniref:Response regulator n=1 Tax=Paenibacillus silvestris TaxID=2606219 RepID=A0A6L8V4L3_9BACL|nr:response regulator [Paenibacillus silvestris]MZQ85358.1 response regulator [Paenibacillus silvestris]